ncbi:MAG TPA: hypothetical protein VHL51_10780 [Gaiellales bacterium]|nr:hypothetical protein [Gaiellales bacterium]
MRRLAVAAVLAALAVFGAHAARAQASTKWPARCTNFKCVNAHLNALHSAQQTINKKLNSLAWVNVCLDTPIPITQYNGYLFDDGAGGSFDTTALDGTASGDPVDYGLWATTPGNCGSPLTAAQPTHPVVFGGRTFLQGGLSSHH